LVGLIFYKFVRNFTNICKKILQICENVGKLCLVGLGPGAKVRISGFSTAVHRCKIIITIYNNFKENDHFCGKFVNVSKDSDYDIDPMLGSQIQEAGRGRHVQCADPGRGRGQENGLEPPDLTGQRPILNFTPRGEL
jgi:hypothetical protein